MTDCGCDVAHFPFIYQTQHLSWMLRSPVAVNTTGSIRVPALYGKIWKALEICKACEKRRFCIGGCSAHLVMRRHIAGGCMWSGSFLAKKWHKNSLPYAWATALLPSHTVSWEVTGAATQRQSTLHLCFAQNWLRLYSMDKRRRFRAAQKWIKRAALLACVKQKESCCSFLSRRTFI